MKYIIDEEELISCLYHRIDIIAVKSLLKSEQPVEEIRHGMIDLAGELINIFIQKDTS